MKQYTTLSLNVIPAHYTLTFEPNLKTFTFQGTAHIALSILKSTKIITLHAKELEIHSALFQSGKKEFPATIKLNPSKEELILTFPQSIKGKANLVIQFKGVHNDRMYGFYRSTYTIKGKEQHLLTSQFEAANARAAFPCFDEPAFKATFDVSLTIPSKWFPISNMLIKKQKSLPKGRKQVWFHTSPKMSTYLLYLGAGDFKFLSTKKGKVLIRVLATPDKINLGHLALNYTKTFLQFFEDYFGIPYPLPKVDVIAIPDFASGAMENWGAITFREIALLGDEKTSVFVKQNIAITVAHELAHQWFGNLVTMQWWDDLWLNESFATFMSFKAVNAAFPDWDLPLQYFYDTIATALGADQLLSTHPINVTVKTPGEIDEIFDAISYDKGGSVLTMLEAYVGETSFRKGLSSYLKKYSYKNATKFDLWNAIQQAHGGKSISSLVERWITQPGYPLLHVEKVPGGYKVIQKRFTLLGKSLPQSWTVPINYLTVDGKQKSFLLTQKNTTLKETGKWIKLNHHQSGFYRVQYDADTLDELGSLLRQQKVSPIDAAGIENDLFSLTLAGQYSLRDYLFFLENNCLEGGYPLNEGVSVHLSTLFRLTYGKELFSSVQRISILFHRRLLNRIGWERKEHERNTLTLLRGMALVNLGMAGHEITLQKLAAIFQSIKEGKNGVDPNIRGAVYNVVAWTGNEATYHYFLERYKTEKIPEESRKLLRALGLFKEKHLLEKALELSQSSTVRLQDSIMIPITVSVNPAVEPSLLWHWTKINWKMLMKKYGGGTHMLPSFVHNLSVADTKAQHDAIKSFFSQKQNFRDDISLAFKQTLERIEINIQLVERNGLKPKK